MPGFSSFTRTEQACRPLLVMVVESDTDTTDPWTEPSKFPMKMVAGCPT